MSDDYEAPEPEHEHLLDHEFASGHDDDEDEDYEDDGLDSYVDEDEEDDEESIEKWNEQ